MDVFEQVVSGWKPLSIFAKSSILDTRQCSKYASDIYNPINGEQYNFDWMLLYSKVDSLYCHS